MTAGFLHNSDGKIRLHAVAYSRFIEPGLPEVCHLEIGPVGNCLYAAYSAPELQKFFAPSDRAENNLIWPIENGPDYGSSIEAIHPSIPKISAEDPLLYVWFDWMEVFRLHRLRLIHEGRRWIESTLDIEQAA